MTEEEKACIAYSKYQRSGRGFHLEINGPRVTVVCKNNAVRVIIKRVDAGSFITTDLVESVEVESWQRNVLPPMVESQPPRRVSRVVPITGNGKSSGATARVKSPSSWKPSGGSSKPAA